MEQSQDFDLDVFERRLKVISHALIIATITIIALQTLQEVLMPLFIALGLYLVLKPGANWLEKEGVPPLMGHTIMLLFLTLVIVSTAFFAWLQIDGFLDDDQRIDEYNQSFGEILENGTTMPSVGESFQLAHDNWMNGTGMAGVAEGMGFSANGMGGIVTSSFSTGLMVMFILMFVIFEASLLPGRINAAFPGDSLGRFDAVSKKVSEGVNTYIVVKTGVSFGTGACAGIIMLMFGIDLWFVWALLTFLLNYIPYIGSLMATVPPILLAALSMGIGGMFGVFVIMLLLNQQVWGNVIETKWSGTALDVSPVLLIIVTTFAFWLWGIIGMVVSIPYMMVVKIILENIEQTRPLAVLMSERAPDLKKVWQDALEDGKLETWELSRLLELKRNLGISDAEMNRVAGRSAVDGALERGEVVALEVDFIRKVAKNSPVHDAISSRLVTGPIDADMTSFLQQLSSHLEQTFEEE
jgi:AI-2 transport protein TqsA